VKIRRPSEADAAAVIDLIRAEEFEMAGEAGQTERDHLRNDWSALDLERDVWLVEHDGRLAACVALATEARPLAIGCVHPELRGRGIGALLVDLVEKEACERGLPKLQIPVFAADERARDLLQGRGYREVRRSYRMAIELDVPPKPPEWPAGFAVAPIEASEVDRFHVALDEAFAEEWGHEPEHGVDWASIRTRRHPDQSLWFAVKESDEIAAAAVADEEGGADGWVSAIGVREPWRRRGLGHALLLHCFRELHARGKRRIALGVDAENPTGATRLYERAGMRIVRNIVFFEKTL
jgi:mycothiol synthase